MILSFPRNSTLFKVGKTNTFRLASSAIYDQFGTNMQNIEKSMRRIYVPDGFNAKLVHKYVHYLKHRDLNIFTAEERKTTYILVQTDQSGAEALIVSYLTPHGNYRDLFLNGIKPHVFIGLAFPEHWEKQHPYIHEIAKLKIPDIKNHPNWSALKNAIADSDNNPAETRYYYHYKQTCHSSNYDIKAPTFQLNLLEKSKGKVVLTRPQAEAYLAGYFSLFPEIRRWHSEVQEMLRKTKTLYNLFGFPREWLFTLSENELKEAYAFVPQSTVGCITHIAYTTLQKYIESNNRDWHLLNNCHDSFCAQCPIGEELELGAKMQEFMNQRLMSPRREPFNMKSETQIGFNWGPAKKAPLEADTTNENIVEKYNLFGLQELKLAA